MCIFSLTARTLRTVSPSVQVYSKATTNVEMCKSTCNSCNPQEKESEIMCTLAGLPAASGNFKSLNVEEGKVSYTRLWELGRLRWCSFCVKHFHESRANQFTRSRTHSRTTLLTHTRQTHTFLHTKQASTSTNFSGHMTHFLLSQIVV